MPLITSAGGSVVETAVSNRQAFLVTEASGRLVFVVWRLTTGRARQVASTAAVAQTQTPKTDVTGPIIIHVV